MSVRDWGIDGGYYLDIAQNVRDGLGFVTDVSPFNQGLPYFPFPSPVYPLWPLFLGWLGKLFPLEILAGWTGFFLYFATLGLAWTYGKRIFPGIRCIVAGFELNAGIALATLFAFHRYFFEVTGKPYTEGLSYALLLTALIRSHSVFREPKMLNSIELGVWSGLLLLCRAQLLVFFLGGVGTYLLLAWLGQSRGVLAALALYVLSFTAIIMPELLHIGHLTEANPLWVYFRFDQFQASQALPPFRPLVETSGLLDTLLDRAGGLGRAFGLSASRYSYFWSYGLFPWAVPLALPGMVWVAWQRRERLSYSSLRDRLPTLLFASVALAGLISVHAVHMKSYPIWFFGTRHSLAACFAIYLSLLFLLSHAGLLRKTAILLYICAVLHGGKSLFLMVQQAHQGSMRSKYRGRGELIERINRLARGPDRQVFGVPADLGKFLAPFTPGAGYQEYFPGDQWKFSSVFVEKLGVRYWVLLPGSLERAHRSERAWFESRFRRISENVAGYEVWVLGV